MPFTPFHMGAALIVKPAARQHFSLIAFGFAQIAMDIEPLLGMILGWETLHGWTHTVVGALLIALPVALLSPFAIAPIVRRANRELQHYRLAWLVQPEQPSRGAVWSGVLVGTLSHVLLDSLMHSDMRPLAPFSDANPLLYAIGVDRVYALCVFVGIVGGLSWLILEEKRRRG